MLAGYPLQAVKSLLFISHTRYWFFKYYLLLMFFTPLLNPFLESSSRKNVRWFCILLLVVSCYFGFIWQDTVNRNGYTFFQFIMLYSVGRYIRLYEVRVKTCWALLCYVLSSAVTGMLFYYLFAHRVESWCWRMTFYNNPLVVTAAVALFLCFLNMDIRSTKVNMLAKSTFAIYLISCSLLEKFYYKTVADIYLTTNNNGWVILSILGFVVVFCVVAFLIDPIQRRLNDFVVGKVMAYHPPRKQP